VRRLEGPGGPELHRAVDPARDQSYFLFATTAAQLDYLRFPLGALEKRETRAIAERLGLGVAAKPDSQDICFVPSGRYAEVVEKLRPGAAEPGDIVHVDGRLLGRHGGLLHYTVGQRRGIGISESQVDGEPLYVVRLEPAHRRLVVGPKAALGVSMIRLGAVNWLGAGEPDAEGEAVEVKLRSMSAPVPAHLWLESRGRARVELAEPQLGVAPGQACVFYRGSRVLGGGWIRRGESQAEAAA
jgi:tRNA-specific 2-thiouridylase